MTRANEESIELDRAIDTILRGQAGPADTDDEGELTATARLLRDALPRLHPRFSFEEHVAARLAAARRLSGELASTPEPAPVRPGLLVSAPVEPGGEATGAVVGEHRRLGLVAGSAIASGVSLAGAAIVVWRRSRSGGLF